MTKRLYSVLDTAACATAHKWWLSGWLVAQRSLLSSKPTGKVLFPNTPVVALRLLSFCGVLCLPFPLYIFTLCSYCVCSVKICVVNWHTWLHPIFQRKCSCFLIKIFSFSAEDEVVSNTEVILRTEDHQPGSYNGKLPHFFSTVLLNVWKTHKWQEDVTLRECILSWNKTQNYAKINKAIFIAESSG